MPEAEELLVDAARHATMAARALWKRHRPAPVPEPTILLADARPRLELLVEAVLGRQYPVRVAQASAPLPLLRRLFARDKVSNAPTGPLPGNDGIGIYLPPSLPVSVAAADDYALLALLQALRCQRGSAAGQGKTAESSLAADLYLLAEAVACAFELRRLLPGWGAALDGLHARAVQALENRRPHSHQEAEVATLYGAFLRGGEKELPVLPTPAEALDWARENAQDLNRRYPRERYLPWLGDLVIGRLLPPEAGPTRQSGTPAPPAAAPESQRSAALSRRPRARAAGEDEDDPSPGAWMVQTSEPQPHAEDPFGLNRPEDREPEEDMEGAADSLAELEEARLIHSPSASRESFHSSDPPPRLEEDAASGAEAGIAYPEWDYRAAIYRERAVRVFPVPAQDGPAGWAEEALARHTGMLREIRRRLGAIRPNRQILKGQIEGDDIDCDALVAERSERRAGIAPAGAFYQSQRPAARRLGLVLLIDVSASTDAWVGGPLRIIDVEKEAALVAAAALDGMRMDFAVLAFSGQGPQEVRLYRIKDFGAPWDAGCRRRIAGLEPELYTRLGAALRHAADILAEQPVDHRLLLLFSDGRPNDCDRYGSRYGVEDARQAVIEARLRHISPYCFSVDREGGSYLPIIFGTGRYALVQHPRQLPMAFIHWLHQVARHCQ